MLAIENLQVRADRSDSPALLDGVSFNISPGEAVGLVGPSGCGKTTLLRSVVGLIDPTGGRVTLDAHTPEQVGWPGFRRRVMLVPQRPVFWDGSIWDNICRPQQFAAVHNGYERDTTATMLEAVGLYHKLDTVALQLSEGERQRVSLVRSLLANPKFLLLDEPTSALDADATMWVEALLASAMEELERMGVLLVSHDRALIDRICTRVIDLADYMPQSKAVTHD